MSFLRAAGRTQKRSHILARYENDRFGDKVPLERFAFRKNTTRLLGSICAVILLGVLIFFLRNQVHIEISKYSRRWIHHHVKELRPLAPDGVCWSPSSSYNLSLVQASKALMLHAGLVLREGNDCYDFAALIPKRPLSTQVLPDRTQYHTYWRADLEAFGERQLLLLTSILATQDVPTTSVVLWTNNVDKLLSTPAVASLVQKFADRLSVQRLRIRDLAQDTPLANSKLLDQATDSKAWLDGDLARVLLLYRFGGVWVDFDSLLLRDLRPLLESEWVTQWDCYDKPYLPLNGALMHFYKQSPYLCEMMYAMATEPPPRKGTVDWGSFLYHKVWRRLVANGHRPFAILPWCFADARSCKLDNRLPDPFQPDPSYHSTRWQQLDGNLNSIFAIHLHNQWSKSFPVNGWIRRLVLPKFRID